MAVEIIRIFGLEIQIFDRFRRFEIDCSRQPVIASEKRRRKTFGDIDGFKIEQQGIVGSPFVPVCRCDRNIVNIHADLITA